MPYYSSFRFYIQDATELCDKVDRIKAIIAAMEDELLAAADGNGTEEYRLDDGQTRIHVTTRSMKQMTDSLFGLERLLQMYINRLNGYVVKLVDHESTRRLG